MAEPKIIAFHLPQFHEIEENNRWWGPGFTDWTNVRRAKALFRGHRQPRVPQGDRYYDMMTREARVWQAELAQSKGVHGFCYYHYWFNGRQLLERPVQALLDESEPDFPFCLAWANEPWTRAWDGGDHEVLMPQEYGGQHDWDRHFAYLLRAFQDRRYIRVGGKPMLLIYRTQAIPPLPLMLARWRTLAAEAGLPGLHIVSMLTGHRADERTGLTDAQIEFEPMYTLANHQTRWYRRRERFARHAARLQRWLRPDARPHRLASHDYASLWELISRRALPPHTYPGGFSDWDNSPRRGLRGLVLRNFDTAVFRRGIAAQLAKARESNVPFLFFNAWNEWAEGTYLEPDTENGTQLLDTIAELTRSQPVSPDLRAPQ